MAAEAAPDTNVTGCWPRWFIAAVMMIAAASERLLLCLP